MDEFNIADETTAAFDTDDDWDLNDPDTTESEETQPAEGEEAKSEEASAETPEEADKTEPEEKQAEQEPQDTNAEDGTADQKAEERFDVTFLGNKVSLTKDEVIQLAQKGMNYDHAVGTANDKLKEYEDFFHALSPDEKVEDIMDGVLARVKAQRENIDEGVALQRVKLDRERRALEKSQAAATAQQQQEEARQASFRRFAQEHPDVDPKSIPKEIWAQVAKGGDLSSLYTAHENKQLTKQLKALEEKLKTIEQNNKNKTQSTGSVSTAGKAPEKDAFDAAWDDD